MNLETVLKLKEAADKHHQTMRGVLLGAVEAPHFEVNVDPKQRLEQRYQILSQRLEGLSRFVQDPHHPGWQVTPGVQVASVEASPTPSVWLRFRRAFTGAGRDVFPGVLVADYFDMTGEGAFDLDEPPVGFKADLGKVLATERISLEDLPLDSPYRDRQFGEDPRTAEQRMTLMEQAVDLYQQGLALQ